MNWDAIAAVGEILGATAVLVSLVYLAGQVRGATRFARSEAETEFQNRWNAMVGEMLGTLENANIFRRGCRDLSLLTADERVVYTSMLGTMIDTQRIGMRMHAKGLLAEDVYEGANNAASSIMRSPGALEWWSHTRDFFIHREFIDELIARKDGSPISEVAMFSYDPQEGARSGRG